MKSKNILNLEKKIYLKLTDLKVGDKFKPALFNLNVSVSGSSGGYAFALKPVKKPEYDIDIKNAMRSDEYVYNDVLTVIKVNPKSIVCESKRLVVKFIHWKPGCSGVPYYHLQKVTRKAKWRFAFDKNPEALISLQQ